MPRKLIVSVPEYYEYALKPQNFDDLVARLEHAQCGLWRVCQIDKLTGEVQIEQWIRNNWSDNGANTMIKTVIGAGSPSAFTPANIIVISQDIGFTTLSAQIPTGGTVTNIQVGALTGPTIPSGTKLFIGAGSSTTLSVVLTQAIAGAGTYTVNSVPGPSSTIPVGASVRYDYTAVPTADPFGIGSPVSYTAPLPGGQITYANRQVTITNSGTYIFSTTGSPAAQSGSYTAAWLTNTNPISTTSQTVVHAAFDLLLTIGSTSNGMVTIVEKL